MEMEYEGSYCATKALDVSGNQITVDYLTLKGRPVHLDAGERYTMLMKSSAGLFFFDVRYERREKEGNRFMMVFRAISEPVKSQRRNAFRVPFKEPVRILQVGPFVNTVILADTKAFGPRPQDLKKTWFETKAKDLSEDGMLIYQENPAEINAHIFLMFFLEDVEIFTNAVVKRHAHSSPANARADMIGIQMLELDDVSLKLLRKFVLNYQIQQRMIALEEVGEVY